MNNEVGERKKRMDKKIDVKATMSLTLKKQLYEFAELCNEPVKDIAERLIMKGMLSRYIAEEYSKWLRRDFRYGNAIAIGDIERPRLKLTMQGDSGKVTMRFKQYDYDRLKDLAYALDMTPSATATILIRLATKESEFMRVFANEVDADDEQREKIYTFLKNTWRIQFKREDAIEY